VVPAEDAKSLLKRARREERIVRPFLGGEEVNTSPVQSFHRYVIDFTDVPLDTAKADFPVSFQHLSVHVKPYRESLRDHGQDKTHKWRWWQFANSRDEMREQLRALRTCLVAARVTSHLCVSFQPTSRVFSDQLVVFALTNHSAVAVLQSRVHETWARVLSSSLGDALRYSVSDCFETFPFPRPDPRAVLAELEGIGEQLYATRAQYMLDENIGLTIAYNRLKDVTCRNAAIERLRELHVDMDRAVLAAYGWGDIEPPPYTTALHDNEKKAIAAFEDAVIDRLFALNAKRADEERAKGLAGGKAKQSKTGRTKRTSRASAVATQPQLELGAHLKPTKAGT